MNAQEIQQQLVTVALELETVSMQNNAENESDEKQFREKAAKERIEKRNTELHDKAVARYAGVEWFVSEREKELREAIARAQRPLATSGDISKLIVSQNYDSRAREFVGILEDPERVSAEIESNLGNPDYCYSLIEWAKLKWGFGPRSKLGIPFDGAVEKLHELTGLTALNGEVETMRQHRNTIAIRREISEVGIYGPTEEDKREAERVGLDLEAVLQIRAGRLKRQRQKAALAVA